MYQRRLIPIEPDVLAAVERLLSEAKSRRFDALTHVLVWGGFSIAGCGIIFASLVSLRQSSSWPVLAGCVIAILLALAWSWLQFGWLQYSVSECRLLDNTLKNGAVVEELISFNSAVCLKTPKSVKFGAAPPFFLEVSSSVWITLSGREISSALRKAHFESGSIDICRSIRLVSLENDGEMLKCVPTSEQFVECCKIEGYESMDSNTYCDLLLRRLVLRGDRSMVVQYLATGKGLSPEAAPECLT